MTDENEDKPKRSYTRRSYTGVSMIDSAINNAIDGAEDEIVSEFDADGAVEVEEIEVEKPKTNFIYQEPRTDSVTAKMMRKLGIGGKMEPMTPWKGKERWKCSRCGWETFFKDKAKRHACS